MTQSLVFKFPLNPPWNTAQPASCYRHDWDGEKYTRPELSLDEIYPPALLHMPDTSVQRWLRGRRESTRWSD